MHAKKFQLDNCPTLSNIWRWWCIGMAYGDICFSCAKNQRSVASNKNFEKYFAGSRTLVYNPKFPLALTQHWFCRVVSIRADASTQQNTHISILFVRGAGGILGILTNCGNAVLQHMTVHVQSPDFVRDLINAYYCI